MRFKAVDAWKGNCFGFGWLVVVFQLWNQRNFRSDQLQERVKKHIIDCCWLLFPVTDMVVSITCTNQFGIEALTNPQKDISFRLFLLQSKKNIHPKATKKTSSSWILVKWCFTPSTRVSQVPKSVTCWSPGFVILVIRCMPKSHPTIRNTFVPSDRLASLVCLEKKTLFRLDRPFGEGTKGYLGDVCCLELCFLKKLRKVKIFKVWDDSSRKTFIIFNTSKKKWIEDVISVGTPHHLIKNWGKPFLLTRPSQEDQRPILTSAMEQRELEAHL